MWKILINLFFQIVDQQLEVKTDNFLYSIVDQCENWD